MMLESGINLYVQQKRRTGMSFAKGQKVYEAFLRSVGNLPISQIGVHHVWQFLNRPQTSVMTFRRRHSLIRRFLEFWAAHGEMTMLSMPANLPAPRSNFLPYIYSKGELRKLLRSAPLSRTSNDKIHPKTVRAAILTLYATGATVSEVTRLCNEDVDLRHCSILFCGSRLKSSRCIPIGRDLVRMVRQFAEWKKRVGVQSSCFFPRIDGREITARSLGSYFERVRKVAGIAGHRGIDKGPCLRDFRTTFAVHQIASWLKRKDDLNRMLPALGAYMGNVGLESTERYLQLTPERFQSALNKLSPQNSRTRWRGNSGLMEFLSSL